MSNSEQSSNRLQLDQISILVNLSFELGQIMTIYDVLDAKMKDFEQCLNQLQFDLMSLLVNFSCELGQIKTR